MIERIYHHYEKWEDYKAGMYDISQKENESQLIYDAEQLLKDEILFLDTAFQMVQDWTISAAVNLSNININRRSWVGQASCYYQYQTPEILTRTAWGNITEYERIKANQVADKIIRWYEAKNKRIYTAVGKQLLFEWDS